MTTVEDTNVTIPTSPAELEELLTDTPRVQAVIKAGKLQDLITNYARTVYDKDMSIRAQVTELTQQALAEMLRETGADNIPRLNLAPGGIAGTAPAANPAAARGGLYNHRAMGAALDKEFNGPEASAKYFHTIWHNAPRTADNLTAQQRIRNAFSSTVPSEGGFLIPESLRSELLRVSLESAVVRSRARVIPMESLRVPFPAIDTTSNVSSVYGGIVGYWTEEGAALTESAASFGRIVLDAKKLTAYTTVPNELLSDSLSSFQAFIDLIFPEALAFYEDIAFLQGNGVGMPLGMLNTLNSAMIAVTKESGQASGTILWENIVKMFARMLPQSLDRAIWIASIDTFPELATMALSVGTGGAPVWLSNGAAGPPMTILGRPVIFSEKAPAVLGTQGDISFVDPGFYLIGDRQVMSAMSSPHFKFANDQTAYRIIERVDGRPWIQSAITPQNNGPTLSPFVQLQTR